MSDSQERGNQRQWVQKRCWPLVCPTPKVAASFFFGDVVTRPIGSRGGRKKKGMAWGWIRKLIRKERKTDWEKKSRRDVADDYVWCT